MSAALATIRETLLRRPSLIDGRAASVRLLAAKEKCSPQEADYLLGRLALSNSFADLFRAVMPKEFKKDTGSRANIAERFADALGFPIYMEEIENAIIHGTDPLAFDIPIVSLNGHLCANCYDFALLTPLYQLSSILFESSTEDLDLYDEEDAERVTQDLEARWEFFAKEYKLPADLRPDPKAADKNLKALGKDGSPLRFFPEFCRMMNYSTGSIFFDFDPNEGPPELEWSTGVVPWLRKQYKLALEIERDLETLSKWFYQNPRERILQALRICRKATNAKRKPRVADAKRGTLVRIL